MMQSAPMSITPSASYDSVTAAAVSSKSTQRQLTVMLVTICCAAVSLQLPYTILYLLNAEKDSLWPNEHDHLTLHAKLYLSMKVTDMLATANYAVNFALYCVSGSAFRHSARRLLRSRRRVQRHGGRYHRARVTKTVNSNTRRSNRSATNEPVTPIADTPVEQNVNLRLEGKPHQQAFGL